ncbi:MAG: HAMP domain-containing histidine kinase [Nitrospinae bacterium]|nr:HAMP domain-containing histidine kinase [Nitrospinota bacterium]
MRRLSSATDPAGRPLAGHGAHPPRDKGWTTRLIPCGPRSTCLPGDDRPTPGPGRQHRPAGVQLEEHLSDPVPLVKANGNEIEQVFLNLFLNALDAMPQGGRLGISTRSEPEGLSDGRPAIAVVVEDTGTGIPEGNREKIFQPFFTTKEEGQGTGLGLSICMGLVRSHGGKIKVESEPGQGTRFTVRLPMEITAVGQESPYG